MAGAVVCVLAASGLIADRIGRRMTLAATAGLIADFSFVAPFMLRGGQGGKTAFMLIVFAILGVSFGQASGSVSAAFSMRTRYTDLALTLDMAWLVGAGFAPTSHAVTSRLGLLAIGGYLLSGTICTLVALRIDTRLASRRSLRPSKRPEAQTNLILTRWFATASEIT